MYNLCLCQYASLALAGLSSSMSSVCSWIGASKDLVFLSEIPRVLVDFVPSSKDMSPPRAALIAVPIMSFGISLYSTI